MSELSDFVNACLDADEAAGKAATPGPWVVFDMDDAEKAKDAPLNPPGKGWYWVWAESRLPYYGAVLKPEHHDPNCMGSGAIGSAEIDDSDGGPQEQADAEFIARFNPARMLEDVDGKRRIMQVVHDLRESDAWWETEQADVIECALAQSYSDRPGFQEKWVL